MNIKPLHNMYISQIHIDFTADILVICLTNIVMMQDSSWYAFQFQAHQPVTLYSFPTLNL